MFLDFLEKREETTDSITLTDEEKIFLKVFGIDSEQPAAAMREATYFTCIKQLSEAVAKTPLYLVQDTENGIRRATEERLTLARASAVTYELFRLSKLWLTSKDYLHIVRTYSPSWDYQANIKKDASG